MAKVRFVRGWLGPAVALLALGSGGCVALAIGGAAGGVAAGYAIYQNGQYHRDYQAPLPDAAAAVRTALTELKLEDLGEKRDGEELYIDSRTGDGARVKIRLQPVTKSVPADGPLTDISIRVGNFGDEAVSTRLLDQVSLHLIAPVLIRPSAAPPPAQPGWVPPPAARETAPPPLAGPAK